MQATDDVTPNPADPPPINLPRLDRKIEAARRRAEEARRAAAPFVPTPERFEKGDHKAPGAAP